MADREASAQGFSAWTDSVALTFNTTSTGAEVIGSVADFPVLIRLDSGNFLFSRAKNDGSDLRFSEPDGVTSLPYQIERWDAESKRAEIWVRVPQVDGDSKADFIKMYWGNSAANPVSDGKAVFDAPGGYAAVWHLNGDFSDATVNANLGRNAGTTATSGMVAAGRAFDGSAQDITVPNSNSLNVVNNISLSAWIKPDTWAGGNRRILQKGVLDNQYQLYDDLGDSLTFRVNSTLILRCPGTPVKGWHHVFATWDGAQMKLYVDGELKKSAAAAGTIKLGADSLRIGGKPNSIVAGDRFDGDMDEVAVAGRARSADWIKLSYANQRASQTLVVFAPLDTASCRRQFGTSSDTALTEGAKGALTGTAECASGYSWEIVSGPAPRLLDPDVKSLPIVASRAITKDTVVVYRFTARFGDSTMSKDVKVTVKEAIPDPLFTLPASIDWNGQDTTVIIRPTLSNLAAVKASPDSVINYIWSLSGVEADTALVSGGLRLRRAFGDGIVNVELCLDNGGAALCRTSVVNVKLTVGVGPGPATPALGPRKIISGRDLNGRRVRAPDGTGRIPLPLFSKP